jgi:hypothetical protein
MYGLLEFKQSFGGRWVELSGAHERIVSQARRRAGTLLVGVGRGARRLAGSRKTDR